MNRTGHPITQRGNWTGAPFFFHIFMEGVKQKGGRGMGRPTTEQIDAVQNLALDQMDAGGSKLFGMTFEEGVEHTIRWMRGEADDPPLEEEE